ncbi:MAG: Rab family GTPase [Candidatus Thorarchaeota archaeon]|jgi:small GTP-binding protein
MEEHGCEDMVTLPRVVKLAVVGAGGAGKTTLISRLITGSFISHKMTVGFDVESWTVVPDGTNAVKVSCFDLGGQKQFRFFQGALVTGAKAALILVDCTAFHSLLEVYEWMPMISRIPNGRKVLVGTKIDLPCVVSTEDLQEQAEKLGIHSVMVSSKTGKNFDELVNLLCHMIEDV